MKVGIFYNSISNPAKFSNKTQLMDLFATGVLAVGDTATEIKQPKQIVTDIDAAFVLGYTLEKNFRRQIIDTLKSHNIPTVFVDSNILHYARSEHQWHRYSLNGVYPTDGVYFFNPINTEKWNIYSQYHNVELKPWRTNGHHVLMLCQRPQGWNMFGNDQFKWIDRTVKDIRKYTDRPIVIRLHPGDGSRAAAAERIRHRHGSAVSVSTDCHILEDLTNCWSAVGYNSTPNVVAAIEGIPVWVADPANSWAQDVAYTDLSDIENPPLVDRNDWLHRIANIHWSNQEVASGGLWTAVRSYILQIR